MAVHSDSDDTIIWEMQADPAWQRQMKYVTILSIAILIIAACIIDSDLPHVLIRLLIFVIVLTIIHFKSDTIFGITIQLHHDGSITVRRWLYRKTIVPRASGSVEIKKGKVNWLLGGKTRIPISAFPNLEQEIGEVSS